MANIRLGDINKDRENKGASIDVTKNKQITKPATGVIPHPKYQASEGAEFDMSKVKSVRSERPKQPIPTAKPVTPVPGPSHSDLNKMKTITNVNDILPPKKVEMSNMQDELFADLDKAVDRTKKQITEDQAAIMEKIYEEVQERDARLADEQDEQEGVSDDNMTINFIEDDDKELYEDDNDLYSSNTEDYQINDNNTSDYNEHEENDDNYENRENEDFSYVRNYTSEVEPNKVEEDDYYTDEDNDVETSDEDVENIINENNAEEITPEEQAEDDEENDKKIVKELSQQVKNRVSNNIKRVDLSSFTIAKKPVSITKAMQVTNYGRGNTADWVLFSAKRPITVKTLTGTQIISLNNRNSNKNRLNSFKDIFKILYDGIIDSNKPTFEAWLKLTRFSDIPHIYYAYYRATFAGSNFVHYTCTNNKCDKGVFIKDIDFDDMVRFPNEEMKREFNEILSNDTTTHTNIYKPILKQISDNYVFGIRNPSIWNVIIETASLSEAFLDKYGDLIDTVSYIDAIYLINRTTHQLEMIDTKPDKSNQTKTAARKIRAFNDILKGLSTDQFFALREAINELEQNVDQIKYLIPATTCPYCGAKIEETEMSPDTMLFTRHQLGAFASISNTSIL